MSNLDSRRRWLALLILCLGDLMIVLDVTIVGVALPSIRTDLGFSESSLAWVVNGYLIVFGGFLLLGGRLGDLFGHRRLFLIGISLFTAASLACGLSTSQGMLVTARSIQGLGAAIVAAVVLSLRLIPGERAPAAEQRLDLAGAVTVTVSLMLAVYAIVNGNEVGWVTFRTIGLLGVAAAIFGVFLAIEARIPAPLVPLWLFKLRNLSFANVVGVLWAAAMFAWFFLSALYLQLVLGYSPLALGLAVLASLAASRTETLADAGDGPLVSLTGGYHAAFLVGALFALGAAIIGGTFLRTQEAPAHGGEEAMVPV